MKTHPVPQNIMDVEFKLFGELTVRQFGYVAGGASIAFVCYVIFNGLDIVRWPLVIFFAILGLMLALFKVNDRPFEVWLANFIYAMFTSQRKVWKKSNKIPNILSSEDIKRSTPGTTSTINKAPLSSVYTSPTESIKNNVDREEQNSLNALDSLFEGSSNIKQKEEVTNIDEVPNNIEEYKLPKGENPFMKEYLKEEKAPPIKPLEIQDNRASVPVFSSPNEPKSNIEEPVIKSASSLDLEDILPETKSREELMKYYDEKQKLVEPQEDLDIGSNLQPQNEKKITNENNLLAEVKPEIDKSSDEYIKKLRQQLEEQNNVINNLRIKSEIPIKPSELVEQINKEEQTIPINTEVTNQIEPKKIETQITVPNIVTGIIKEQNNKAVANATIIIKDSKYRPVRAMRSSNLGKFVTTTPLADGEYILEASKDNLKFESVDFTLDGKESKVMEIFAI